MRAHLNKRERRAAQLLAHYATCERLAAACGLPAAKIDGKKISVALWKLEREVHDATTARCNGAAFGSMPFLDDCGLDGEESESSPWRVYMAFVAQRLAGILGGLPDGFFINGDARGYALKIDDEDGAELIAATRMHTDCGRFGILSPEITGD